MRAVLVALGAIALASACECPDIASGNFFASGGPGQVIMPPCCKDTAAAKAAVQDPMFSETKHTPGGSCATLASCDACTILTFCRWSEATKTCSDEVNLGAGDDYVAKCSDIGHAFTMAILANEGSRTFDHLSDQDKATHTEEPVIARDESGWPQQYDGYLPPSGCIYIKSMTKAEIAAKYPSGLPGCGDYVNEGYTAEKGHMTTDIVSDPRLPVETHKPNFPLGANPNLPDGLVMGGDYDSPQPLSPWVKPAFNANGCLGGPCDEPSQHACVGLSCSHLKDDGDATHDERKGSMYKRGGDKKSEKAEE